MRRVAFAVSAFVVLAGGSAQAQTPSPSIGESIQHNAGSAVIFNEGSAPPISTHGGSTGTVQTFGPGPGTASSSSSDSKFNSYVTVAPDSITFESSNQGAGPFVGTGSFSEVQFDVHNPTGGAINFSSTITPAGLGFYLTNSPTSCATTGSCVEALGTSLSQAFQTSSFLTTPEWANTEGYDVIAYSLFDFEVVRATGSGEQQLYSLQGFLGLGLNADGVAVPIDRLGEAMVCIPGADCTFATGARSLLGFHEDVYRDSAIGYSWDATDFSFNIGSALDQTLIYRTSVISFSATDCQNDGLGPCLVAYSGFGDPIGRGGGVQATLTNFRALGSNLGSPDDPIGGVSFQSAQFDRPFIDGQGNVRFGFDKLVDSGVPEPATWISLILGFGLLGTALRRRVLTRA